jgi:hypothetical protein
MPTNFTATDAIENFLDAQRADFTRTQAQRMVAEADRDGASRDFGDGYNIIRDGNSYQVQVRGRWL